MPSPVGEPKLEIRRGRASVSLMGWGGCRCLISLNRELGLGCGVEAGLCKEGTENEEPSG
jgi:hypothetical protein